jgi:hypothetical protein
MRTRAWTAALGVALTLSLPGLGRAAIMRDVTSSVETVECDGESVDVIGSSGDLTLLGECPDVQVKGTLNTIRIEVAGRIDIAGVGNRIVWERGLRGIKPSIQTSGHRNAVWQGLVGAPHRGRGGESAAGEAARAEHATLEPRRTGDGTAPALVVAEDYGRLTIDCQGEDVSIRGSYNALFLVGECRNVSVSGNENDVHIDAVVGISASGNGNDVKWHRGAGGRHPRISNLGRANGISHTSDRPDGRFANLADLR